MGQREKDGDEKRKEEMKRVKEEERKRKNKESQMEDALCFASSFSEFFRPQWIRISGLSLSLYGVERIAERERERERERSIPEDLALSRTLRVSEE